MEPTSDGNPLWVAVGQDSGYGNIMYSSNGQSWTKTSTGDSFSDFGSYGTSNGGVAYGTCNGTPLWVAVGVIRLVTVLPCYGNIMYYVQ